MWRAEDSLTYVNDLSLIKILCVAMYIIFGQKIYYKIGPKFELTVGNSELSIGNWWAGPDVAVNSAGLRDTYTLDS